MIREWMGLLTGRCLREAKQGIHDSNQYHREEIARMLEKARKDREDKEAKLKRLEQAVSIEEMTGAGGDD